MKQLLFSLLRAGLFLAGAGCKDDSASAAEAQRQLTRAVASSPQAKARAAAWQLATTRPPRLAAGAPATLRPAVEQLLPREGYLHLVSARLAGPAEPATLPLPVLWRPVQGRYPGVAPGYRLPFAAVLTWQPTGYAPGERVPAALALDGPWAPDTLRSFTLREPALALPGQPATTSRLLKPGQAVTVRGVLYAYAIPPSAGQSPRLVLYPYQDPLGPPDARKMVYLPL